MKKFLIFQLVLSCILLSCSSALRKNEKVVHQILLYNLHLRRPSFVGASVEADWGDYEFVSHPQPNPDMDCETFKSLFAGVDLGKLRECLINPGNLQGQAQITYILQREVQPYLKLD